MKILHTSDWHVGRTFQRHSTLDHLALVLEALAGEVRARGVDAVVVAGDVFDSSMPSAQAYAVLGDALRAIKAAGADVVITSGNHDSATRLGFQAEWAAFAGIHVVTAHDGYLRPVTLHDEHGPVHVYGIPYLEPALIRHHHPERELRSHVDALTMAMDAVRADLGSRGGRSVVASHCFVSDIRVSDEASDVERDITSGGLNLVPASVFDGPDYVALGHIHGRSTLTERVRYSGAPLHYSFGEAAKPRGAWLVSLDAEGLESVEWVELPVPRRLSVITGELGALLSDASFAEFEGDWVSAVVTDRVRPLDGMRRLQERFAHAVEFRHAPAVVAESTETSYAERVAGRTDGEIVGGFLEHVRNGVGPDAFETALIDEVLHARQTAETGA